MADQADDGPAVLAQVRLSASRRRPLRRTDGGMQLCAPAYRRAGSTARLHPYGHAGRRLCTRRVCEACAGGRRAAPRIHRGRRPAVPPAKHRGCGSDAPATRHAAADGAGRRDRRVRGQAVLLRAGDDAAVHTTSLDCRSVQCPGHRQHGRGHRATAGRRPARSHRTVRPQRWRNDGRITRATAARRDAGRDAGGKPGHRCLERAARLQSLAWIAESSQRRSRCRGGSISCTSPASSTGTFRRSSSRMRRIYSVHPAYESWRVSGMHAAGTGSGRTSSPATPCRRIESSGTGSAGPP